MNSRMQLEERYMYKNNYNIVRELLIAWKKYCEHRLEQWPLPRENGEGYLEDLMFLSNLTEREVLSVVSERNCFLNGRVWGILPRSSSKTTPYIKPCSWFHFPQFQFLSQKLIHLWYKFYFFPWHFVPTRNSCCCQYLLVEELSKWIQIIYAQNLFKNVYYTDIVY